MITVSTVTITYHFLFFVSQIFWQRLQLVTCLLHSIHCKSVLSGGAYVSVFVSLGASGTGGCEAIAAIEGCVVSCCGVVASKLGFCVSKPGFPSIGTAISLITAFFIAGTPPGNGGF